MKDDTLFVRHILDAIEEIDGFLAGVSFEKFEKNHMMQNAVLRDLEVIGEAAGRLSDDFRKTHATIPWHKIVGMRNKLIHEYFDVDIEAVWKTCSDDLQPLKNMLLNFLHS